MLKPNTRSSTTGCSRPPEKSGRRLVSSKNHLLIAPEHTFTKLCALQCTGTNVYSGFQLLGVDTV